MKLLRRPISASDRIPDRFYVISMSRRRSSSRNVPSGEERGETDVFVGYKEHRQTTNNPLHANATSKSPISL